MTGPGITVDSEFSSLIPKLTNDEFNQLEKNVLEDGCRDPLTVWLGQNILLDGHNRLAICEKHELEFDRTEIAMKDRDAAKAWIIRNQFGRRNLTLYQRSELALVLEPLLRAEAGERLRKGQIEGGKTAGRGRPQNSSGQNSAQSKRNHNRARDELGRIAGVSRDTIGKVQVIQKTADEETKEKLRSGEISVNKAYCELKMKKEKNPDKKTEKRPWRDMSKPFEPNGKRATDIAKKQLERIRKLVGSLEGYADAIPGLDVGAAVYASGKNEAADWIKTLAYVFGALRDFRNRIQREAKNAKNNGKADDQK